MPLPSQRAVAFATLGHGVAVYAVPSALHVRRPSGPHETLFGAQRLATHCPALQRVPVPQGTVLAELPSALHTRSALSLAQVTSLGVHTPVTTSGPLTTSTSLTTSGPLTTSGITASPSPASVEKNPPPPPLRAVHAKRERERPSKRARAACMPGVMPDPTVSRKSPTG